MRYNTNISRLLITVCLCSLLLCACDGNSTRHDSSTSSSTPSDNKNNATESVSGTWDNTPNVLTPEASGTDSRSNDVAVIDYSNSSEGYIMVKYTGDNSKVKLQITGPDGITYTYDLHGGYEVFPLTAESGGYSVGIYENISGTQYSTALTFNFNADINNEFGPYLYPNQYVNFDASSLPVSKGQELAKGCSTDVEVVESVYNYIIDNFTYDYDKAATVQSGYIPVVDDVFNSNTGICFDYAAVMATMLRSQGIPTRLEVGYMGEDYHAWISTYIENVGWVNGIIEFDGEDWKLMDPTFASTSKSPESFTTDDSKYITKYVY